ncbi:hypothetical protein [Halosimplex sp. J119]
MSTRSAVSRTRPLGVTIICILAGLGALLGLLGSVVILGANPLLGLFTFVVSVGQLVAVVGLWNLHTWGWSLGVALYGLSGLIDLVTVDPFGAVISAIIVLYLFTKRPLFD